MRIEIWDKTKIFLLADAKERTIDEIAMEFPFVKDPDAVVVLEYIGKNRVGAINDLWIIRDAFKISNDLSDEEALAEYIRIRNTPPEPEIDANERIAAALEFLSLMSL